jgi:hypothetical protein
VLNKHQVSSQYLASLSAETVYQLSRPFLKSPPPRVNSKLFSYECTLRLPFSSALSLAFDETPIDLSQFVDLDIDICWLCCFHKTHSLIIDICLRQKRAQRTWIEMLGECICRCSCEVLQSSSAACFVQTRLQNRNMQRTIIQREWFEWKRTWELWRAPNELSRVGTQCSLWY